MNCRGGGNNRFIKTSKRATKLVNQKILGWGGGDKGSDWAKTSCADQGGIKPVNICKRKKGLYVGEGQEKYGSRKKMGEGKVFGSPDSPTTGGRGRKMEKRGENTTLKTCRDGGRGDFRKQNRLRRKNAQNDGSFKKKT